MDSKLIHKALREMYAASEVDYSCADDQMERYRKEQSETVVALVVAGVVVFTVGAAVIGTWFTAQIFYLTHR